MLVQTMYNKLALMSGFPVYTNDTDAPEINRFLLEILSQALQNVIDDLYISNNVLERNDTITTSAGEDLYGIEGIIKNIQVVDGNKVTPVRYNDRVNPNAILPSEMDEQKRGKPTEYVIKNGYLKLMPVPDKAYSVKVCVSTTDLVISDDDSSRTTIEHINDSVLASDRFCNLVVTKAAVLLFARLQNPNTQVYAQLYDGNVKTFIEHDLKSIEAQRGHIRRAGHYNPEYGLLDDGGLYY